MPLPDGLPFRDRVDAGRRLAEHLTAYRDRRPVVLGIPRGGVLVAAEVARALGAPLDIAVARKLGAPFSPELALGAVTADGGRFVNDALVRSLGVGREYLESEIASQMDEARRREERLRAARPPTDPTARAAILVDDGLATGATMQAAVRSVRQSRPAVLVVAAPVGSVEACAALRREADAVVCPYELDDFGAVGFYYERFEPVDDEDVRRALEEQAPPTDS